MVEADRPGDPRAISLGFDSWLVRALTKYSIFIFTLLSLPLTGIIIENSGMKGWGHLSAGPSILPAQNILLLKEDRGENQQTDGVGIRFTGATLRCLSASATWASPAFRPLPSDLFLLVCSTIKRRQGQKGGLSLKSLFHSLFESLPRGMLAKGEFYNKRGEFLNCSFLI